MALVGVVDNKSGGVQMFWASAAVDLPSMATLTSGIASVTVTGVLPGDLVIVFPLTTLTSGISVDGVCTIITTANTVPVRVTNATAGTLDPASQVMQMLIIRQNVPL